ncbi:MAG: DivIVA domain-containing protein, partial [Gaiellaceae bacterium]
MAITPVEIRHIQLRKGIRGYRRPAVERLLADIAEDFEEVWRQRADLSDKVEQLESDLQ